MWHQLQIYVRYDYPTVLVSIIMIRLRTTMLMVDPFKMLFLWINMIIFKIQSHGVITPFYLHMFQNLDINITCRAFSCAISIVLVITCFFLPLSLLYLYVPSPVCFLLYPSFPPSALFSIPLAPVPLSQQLSTSDDRRSSLRSRRLNPSNPPGLTLWFAFIEHQGGP